MSPEEPSRWLHTHPVWCKGKRITTKERAKVGALAEPWRKLRAERPGYFDDGKVRVWFQPEATEDKTICCWFSDLDIETAKKAVAQ
eukprot:7887718-Alexandrium_andersonii.AAC.1